MPEELENKGEPVLVKTCPWCHWSMVDGLDIFELPYSICEKCGRELEIEKDRKEVVVEFKLFREADEIIKKNIEGLTPQQRKCLLGTVVDRGRIEIYLDNLLRLTKEDTGALIFMLERITLHELAHTLSPTVEEEDIHRFADKAMVMRLVVKKPQVEK